MLGRPVSCTFPARVPHLTSGFVVRDKPTSLPYQSVSYLAVMKGDVGGDGEDPVARAVLAERSKWSRLVR